MADVERLLVSLFRIAFSTALLFYVYSMAAPAWEQVRSVVEAAALAAGARP